MELWSRDADKQTWRYGALEARCKRVDVEAKKYGGIELCRRRNVEAWRYGAPKLWRRDAGVQT